MNFIFWKDPEEERFENLKKSLKWINEVDDTEIEDLWQKEILDKSAKKASKKSSKKSNEKNIGNMWKQFSLYLAYRVLGWKNPIFPQWVA